MCMDPEFTVLKRFDYLHLRNLLYHSDILAMTEEQLRRLDQQETVQSYLSSRRQDKNTERQNLLQSLDEQLKAYGNVLSQVSLPIHAFVTNPLSTLAVDEAVGRFQTLMNIRPAPIESRQSICNWVNGQKPLVRSESKVFLEADKQEDFMIMQPSDQNSGKRVMEKVFGAAVKYRPEVFQKVCILYSHRSDLANIIKFLS